LLNDPTNFDDWNIYIMSAEKSPKKPAKEAASTEVKKNIIEKNADVKKDTTEKNTDVKKDTTEKSTETTQDSKTTKDKTPPKSASQSSISHFSSVSTPAYRSGWEQIFGNKERVEDNLDDNQDNLQEFSVEDSSIDIDLRSLLYKAFQTEAQKHGFQLDDVNDTSNIVYNLNCKIINN
jgi:hypothetical protein|tara:strand:+ start:382 stop:915 length:534 start_codon:yes stop_codon:yes gene_type:complete